MQKEAAEQAEKAIPPKETIESNQLSLLNQAASDLSSKSSALGVAIQDYLANPSPAMSTSLTNASNAFSTALTALNLAYGNYGAALEALFSAKSNSDDAAVAYDECELNLAPKPCCVPQIIEVEKAAKAFNLAQFKITKTQALTATLSTLEANINSQAVAATNKFNAACSTTPSSSVCAPALTAVQKLTSTEQTVKMYFQTQQGRLNGYIKEHDDLEVKNVTLANERDVCVKNCPK
ncbi:hypothetical protein [Spirosoma koreense]